MFTLMPLGDYIVIALALLLFRPTHWLVLGYPAAPLIFHSERDPYGVGLERILSSFDTRFGSRWAPPMLLTAASFLLFPFWSWQAIDSEGVLFPFLCGCAATAAWRGATQDIDLATGERLLPERLIALGAFAGFCFYPGFAVLLLFTVVNRLRGWTHHQQITVRSLLMLLSFLAASLLPIGSQRGKLLLFLLLLLIASHYAVAGVAKLSLGPRWYSWLKDNRLHYNLATAYALGWPRFLPEERWMALVRLFHFFNLPIQGLILLFELSAFFLLFSLTMTKGFLIAAVVFHSAIFLFSGALFWQLIAVYPLLLWGLASLSAGEEALLFTPLNGALFIALLAALPLRKKVWIAQSLAWWDSPLAAHVRRVGVGVSGRRYEITNDLLCPNERLFGHNYGNCLSKEKKLSKHKGEVREYSLYLELIASGGEKGRLRQLEKEKGRPVYDAQQGELLCGYLLRFFTHWNEGKQKRVCPRWLKAPGELYYYWGRLPKFSGEERLAAIEFYDCEEYFDGKKLLLLHEELLAVIKLLPQ